VALTWTAGSGATSYNVYRGTSAGGESSTAIATGITTTGYTDTGLTNGTTYYYKVTAVNASGTSGYSNEASASPSLLTPPVLTATAGTSVVAIGWNSTLYAAYYNIYRSTTPGGEGSTVYATTYGTSFNDTSVTNGVTYYYKATSVGGSNSSAMSAEVSGTPIAATTLTAVMGSATGTINLTWTAAAGATSYNLYRGPYSGNEALYKTGLTGTSYTDTGLTSGTVYWYYLVAANSTGKGTGTPETSATAK